MNDITKEMLELIDLAKRLGPEDEGIDISDREYAPQDMAEMRSLLSSTRKAIDIVGAALANEWDNEHKGVSYDDGANLWYVARTKGKKVIDPEAFFEWLNTKDAKELTLLVPSYSIKVSGMSDAERTTFLDESPTSDRLTLKSKPNGL